MVRVMVVDDEPSARNRYTSLVSEYGHGFEVVATCSTAREALARRAEVHPHLLMTDIRMPHQSGIELIEKFRAEDWDGIAVVVSGFSEFALAQQAIRVGVFDYLLKPVFPEDMNKLLDAVRCQVSMQSEHALSVRVLRDVHSHCLPRFVRNAIRYVELHLDRSISLSDTAEAACVTPSYLSTAFGKQCGMSFVDFVHAMRVEAAKELLHNPDRSMLEIAEQVGFADKSYFNRVFKRVTGMSPGVYRRRYGAIR